MVGSDYNRILSLKRVPYTGMFGVLWWKVCGRMKSLLFLLFSAKSANCRDVNANFADNSGHL